MYTASTRPGVRQGRRDTVPASPAHRLPPLLPPRSLARRPVWAGWGGHLDPSTGSNCFIWVSKQIHWITRWFDFFFFSFLLFFWFFFPYFFSLFFFFSVLIRMGYSTTVSPTQCQYTCSRGLLDSQLRLYKCTQENLPCYPPPTDWGLNCTFLLTMTGESKQWNRIMGDLSHFPSCFHWFVHTILIIMKGLCA